MPLKTKGRHLTTPLHMKGYNLYAYDRIKFKPKALTDAVFIKKDSLFTDIDRTYTYRYINELQTFRYPTIDYVANEADSTLTANIYLKPRKKYWPWF